MNSKKLKLSLIIPCFNESDNLGLLINKLFEIENNFYEIILVNNGSTDDTKPIAEKLISKKSETRSMNVIPPPTFRHESKASECIFAYTLNDDFDSCNCFILKMHHRKSVTSQPCASLRHFASLSR